jgi:hypothetical protein
MKRIFDPAFRYIPSHSTDIRRTFERVRAEQEAQREAERAETRRQAGPTVRAMREKKTA